MLGVHSGALGDVILFAHLLRGMGGQITLAASGAKARLLQACGVVARSIDFDSLPMHELFSEVPPDKSALAGMLGGYDRLISCFPAGDTDAAMRLVSMCGADQVAFLPVRLPEDSPNHLIELWADMLGMEGRHFRRQACNPWSVPDSWKARAAARLAGLGVGAGEPFLLIHPGAGSPAKCWSLDRFVEVAKAWPKTVFVLGPAESELWDRARIEGLRREFGLVACPELEELAGLLSLSSVVLGNDSGVSHLGGAIGARTLTLFGPTRCEQFTPLGRHVKSLSAPAMEDITIGAVLDCLESLQGEGNTSFLP